MQLRSIASAAAIAGMLVISADFVALAATGDSPVLGRAIKSNQTTVIQNTGSSPALSLKSKGKAPSLAVTSKTKVARLNADRVDGLEGKALQTRSYVFTADIDKADASNTFNLVLDLPPGGYLVSYSAFLSGAQTGWGACFLTSELGDGEFRYVAESRFDSGGQTPGFTGSGYVVKQKDKYLRFDCESLEDFSTFDLQPIQVVATRVDKATNVTPASARGGAPRVR